MRTGYKAAALLAAMALTIAACGGDDAAAPAPAPAPAPSSGDPLVLGYILPETGQLAFLGPPMIAAVQMAVEEINAAGGVFGSPVELLSGDEAGDAAFAASEASRLLAAGVDAIVGAAATGMTLAIIDQVTSAGVVQCSPSNTGPSLTNYPDNGFYFRTAPSDALQGPVLAEQILADGFTSISIVARADDYGRGLLENTVAAFEAAGGDVLVQETFDPEAGTFDSAVEAMLGSGADAHVIISFVEGAAIVQGLLAAGVPTTTLYGADGIASGTFNAEVDPSNPNVLNGMTFTSPSKESTPSFQSRLQAFNPALEDKLFAAQAYDCVNLFALAAVAGGSSDSQVIRDNMIAVTTGEVACDSYAECAEALAAGSTISYQSAAGGPLSFMEVRGGSGEPSVGLYDVLRWIDGQFTAIDLKVGFVS
jgi:ABC-type branched-subunit amino acid transport system substrate-binding protein